MSASSPSTCWWSSPWSAAPASSTSSCCGVVSFAVLSHPYASPLILSNHSSQPFPTTTPRFGRGVQELQDLADPGRRRRARGDPEENRRRRGRGALTRPGEEGGVGAGACCPDGDARRPDAGDGEEDHLPRPRQILQSGSFFGYQLQCLFPRRQCDEVVQVLVLLLHHLPRPRHPVRPQRCQGKVFYCLDLERRCWDTTSCPRPTTGRPRPTRCSAICKGGHILINN